VGGREEILWGRKGKRKNERRPDQGWKGEGGIEKFCGRSAYKFRKREIFPLGVGRQQNGGGNHYSGEAEEKKKAYILQVQPLLHPSSWPKDAFYLSQRKATKPRRTKRRRKR